jgi:hypothetical protein
VECEIDALTCLLGFRLPDIVPWDCATGRQDHQQGLDYCVMIPGCDHRARTDWISALVRWQMIKQRCNRVVVPDDVLCWLAWPRDNRRHRNWRGALARFMTSAFSRRWQWYDDPCPPVCMRHNSGITHRHAVITIPMAGLGVLQHFIDATLEPGVYTFGLRRKREELRKALQEASANYKAGVISLDEAKRAASRYRLYSRRGMIYLPVRLLGHRAGLTVSQVNLLSSIRCELTTVNTRSSRADRAKLVHPFGQSQRLVCFNGNGGKARKSSRRRYYVGYGYSLRSRLQRAYLGMEDGYRANSWRTSLKKFVHDLGTLAKNFGILIGDPVRRVPYGDQGELFTRLASQSSMKALENFRVYLYGPEDYQQRWRDWFCAACEEKEQQ